MLRRLRLLTVGATLVALAGGAAPAFAVPSNGATGRVSGIKTSDGVVQFVFSAMGLPAGATLDTNSIVVQAGDRTLPATASVGDAGAGSTQAAAPVREAIVVIDTSGSMQGDGITGARAAALEYAAGMPADVRVGLVTFADAPHLLLKPSTNRLALTGAIKKVKAGGNTALYDGILTAVSAASGAPRGAVRRLLILSDGDDTASSHSLQDAIQQTRSAGIAVDVVAFRIPGNQTVLKQLASATRGTVLGANSASDLTRAFATAAAAFQSQVLVTVQVPAALAGQQAHLVVTMNTQQETVSSEFDVTLPGSSAKTVGIGPQITNRAVGSVSKAALWFVLGIAFLAMVVVALLALWVPASANARARTQARLAEVGRYRVLANVSREQSAGIVPAEQSEGTLAKAALGFVDRLVRQQGRRKGIVDQLERAGLRMRPEEWAIIQFAVVIATAAVLAIVGRTPVGLFIGAPLGYLGCRAFMNFKISRRSRAFNDQLPDVLQLVAGALRSGFSLNQAVAAVVREGNEPTASEIARALTEVRLGAELEDALDRVADRMSCPDLHWVVLAIRISREVGGNLAEVLMNTVSTMRERAQIRGQIRVLSAEGRISARILIALPFLLAGYLVLTNPNYLHPLYTTAAGIALSIAGVVLLLVGSFWISRIVKIEV